MDAASDDSTGTPTTTTTSSSTSSSFISSLDFELVSMKPISYRYTSLRDILPATAVKSPKAPCYRYDAHSGYEISIRNRLVKQAAWAYLQPQSTSPVTDGPTVVHRLWTHFSGVVLRLITTAFDCLLQPLQIAGL